MESGDRFAQDTDRPTAGQDTQSEEQTLLKLLRNADSEGLNLLMKKYHNRLFSVADGICKNHADAEEVLQDVYWTALSKIDRFEERSSLGTWLYRVTVNLSLMKLRSQKKRSQTLCMSNLTTIHGEEDNALRLAEPARSPGDTLMAKELCKHVSDSVESLPEIYRDVFLLRDVYEFTIRETSLLLETTPAAIKSRLHRSRAHIRRDIAPYLHGN